MATVNENDLKNYREEISEVLRRQPPRLEAACRAFNLNRRARPANDPVPTSNDAEQEMKIYRRISQGIQEGIDEKEMAELLRLRSVLAFINGVAQPVDELVMNVNRKIERRMLFCDNCVRLINDFFRKTQFLTVACADAVLTGSPILKAHVICGTNSMLGEIGYPSSETGDRRLKCSCRPRSVDLYRNMMKNFHTILARVKEIANHIPGPILLETWACPAPGATFRRMADEGDERANGEGR